MASRSDSKKAFVYFDVLFSILPIIIMVVYTMQVSNHILEKGSDSLQRQVVFNKLVSSADYLVKNKFAVKFQSADPAMAVHPNWFSKDASMEFESVAADLKSSLGLKELSISFDTPHLNKIQQKKNCIYRLVVVGEEKEIRKLFVCGE